MSVENKAAAVAAGPRHAFSRGYLLDPDGPTDGKGAEPPPAAPPAPAPAPPPVVAAPPAPPEEPKPLTAKDLQDAVTAAVAAALAKAPPAPPPAPTGDAGAQALAAVRNITIDHALTAAGVTDANQRYLIAQTAPQDVSQIAEHVKKFAPPPAAPAAPRPEALPPAPTPPPGGNPTDGLSDNPHHWPKGTPQRLLDKNPRELIERVERHLFKGSNTNPYARRSR